MRWRKWGEKVIRSDCDRYTICGDKDERCIAFALVKHMSPRLLCGGTQEECKDVCRRHSEAGLWDKSVKAQEELVKSLTVDGVRRIAESGLVLLPDKK